MIREVRKEMEVKTNRTGEFSRQNSIRKPNHHPHSLGGELVSFQTRDITGKAEQRYLGLSKRREVIHHKHNRIRKGGKWSKHPALIVVEGVVDVWKSGTWQWLLSERRSPWSKY